MSGRKFTPVSPAIWRSGRFRGLGGELTAKELYLYFLTCEHQNSAGSFRIPDGYAVADLGCGPDAYVQRRGELIAADMISHDPETAEIYVHRWFKHCGPMNEKHATGIRKMICAIESDVIREMVEADFEGSEDERKSNINPLDTPMNNTGSHLTNTRFFGAGRQGGRV